ncbi:MAG TPA: glycoside hydrolase family 15 protein [Frankiaceae bacterium]|nr:glycoside hydrolase family 15 protein [Frankiaceae bacterium]
MARPQAPSADYPPHVLREYALLADGERGAILGPRGDIVWMCAPRWDSGALFSALIGGAGAYAITPVDPYVWGGFYEPGSLIWHSRWVTTSGIIECREALAFPGDPRRAVLLRRVVALEHDARISVRCSPHGDYGNDALLDVRRSDGLWHARTGSLHLRLSGAEEAHVNGTRGRRQLTLECTVPSGQYRDFVLEVSDQALPAEPADPGSLWHVTETAWRTAIPEMSGTLAPTDTRHSYAVLRGLTSYTGGMVAAATTGLPERAEAGRNYDYRYVWIRDLCYAGHAVAAAGPHPLLDDAVRYLSARLLEHGESLSPAYATNGDRIPDQRRLKLPGYPGGADIVGNRVNSQFQLDAFGEALLLLADAGEHDRLDADSWSAAEVAADAIARRWTENDAGIWEIDNRAWTHSRLTAAAGLRAMAATPPAAGRAADWLSLADAIVANTARNATAPGGHWQRSPDDPALDAALLLPALRGAVPASDPRSLETLAAYTRDLTRDGFAYRFRHDARPLGDAEGAFLLCGFLLALATHQQGDALAALGWFERTRAACGPPQLFSEEYDQTQHQMRGNLPQAFVHALMIEASVRLAG